MKQLFFNNRTRRYYYQFAEPLTGKRIQFSCQTGDKKLAVQFALDKMASPIGRPSIASQMSGTYPKPRPSFASQMGITQRTVPAIATKAGTTIKTFADEYFNTFKSRLSENTIEVYRESVRRLTDRLGEHYPLEKLTVRDAEKFIHTGHPSPQSAARHLRTLRGIFEKAVKWELMKANPFVNVEKPIIIEKEQDYLTEEEFERFIVTVPDATPAQKTMRNIFILDYETALRLGELRNMRISQINFEKKYVAVKNQERVFRTKSGKPRLVPLSSKALEAIKSQMSIKKQSLDADMLFPGRVDGKPLSGSHVSREFKKYVMAVFPDRDGLCFHGMRHSTAKKAFKKNVPVLELQQIMGHSTVRLTEKYGYSQRTSFPGFEEAFNA